MATKARKPKSHPGRGGNNVSLHPLTTDQALTALLSVSPKDVKAIRDKEAAMKRAWRKPKAKR